MSSVELHVSAGLAARLRDVAAKRGVEPDELAEQAIAEFIDPDPFEFIGSIQSSEITGENADQFLRSSDFGS